mgnify:CR=1 FL=1
MRPKGTRFNTVRFNQTTYNKGILGVLPRMTVVAYEKFKLRAKTWVKIRLAARIAE